MQQQGSPLLPASCHYQSHLARCCFLEGSLRCGKSLEFPESGRCISQTRWPQPLSGRLPRTTASFFLHRFLLLLWKLSLCLCSLYTHILSWAFCQEGSKTTRQTQPTRSIFMLCTWAAHTVFWVAPSGSGQGKSLLAFSPGWPSARAGGGRPNESQRGGLTTVRRRRRTWSYLCSQMSATHWVSGDAAATMINQC